MLLKGNKLILEKQRPGTGLISDLQPGVCVTGLEKQRPEMELIDALHPGVCVISLMNNKYLVFLFLFLLCCSCTNKDTEIYIPLVESNDEMQFVKNNKINIAKRDKLPLCDGIVGLSKRGDVFEVTLCITAGRIEGLVINLSDSNGNLFEQTSPFSEENPSMFTTNLTTYDGKVQFQAPSNAQIKMPLVVTIKATVEMLNKHKISSQVKFTRR